MGKPTLQPKRRATITKGDNEDAVFVGDAHRVFDEYARKNGAKDGTRTLVKGQVTEILKKMRDDKRIFFATQNKLQEFVEKHFEKHDIDHNGRLTLEEFIVFYRTWLMGDSDAVMKQLQSTQSELEKLFIQFDSNHDYYLAKGEIVELLKQKLPKGLPKADDKKLEQIVDEVLKTADSNDDGQLDFEEFSEGYNDMMDLLGNLVQEIQAAVSQGSNFRGLVKSESFQEEEEYEQLVEEAKARFDKPTWVVQEHELLGLKDDTEPNVLERARAKGKITLLCKHPSEEYDNIAQYFSSHGHSAVLDLQELCLQVAEHGLTHEKMAETVRQALVDAWSDGKVLAMRFGHSTPDFMFSMNLKDVLPVDVFTGANLKPGKLEKDAKKLLRPNDGSPDRFEIKDGFHLVICTCKSMDNWRTYLRGKIPMGEVQPVQVCKSLEQVVTVLKVGVPKDNMEDDLSELDRLADML